MPERTGRLRACRRLAGQSDQRLLRQVGLLLLLLLSLFLATKSPSHSTLGLMQPIRKSFFCLLECSLVLIFRLALLAGVVDLILDVLLLLCRGGSGIAGQSLRG